MKKLRVLVLAHANFVPPKDIDSLSDDEQYEIKSEVDVIEALGNLGHEVQVLGVLDELRPIREAVRGWKPHIVFNLLEEFGGEAVYDQNVVAYLELLRVPYTGCSPRGLIIARDKALSKQLLAYHRIRCPRFKVARKGRSIRRPKQLDYPIIVKSLNEEASRGISRASIVDDDEALGARVKFIHQRIRTDAILEQFIPGRELYVGILGNQRLTSLPPRELMLLKKETDETLIATERMKHNIRYQEKYGVEVATPRPLPDGVAEALARTSKRIYRTLGLEGYGRIDYRMDSDGRLFFLEANPNPEIARYEEFASAAEAAGLSYEDLIQRILNLGLRR
ncbi:MAG: D-alanine--D-alanine ligase [Gammaproteobacteria bacterium]|nr:D-alanine--D-alanine ligase [Gammaproteobacteria bacterium]